MSAQAWQRSSGPQRVTDPTAMRPASGQQQQRQRNDESWVEVASHPSSSSVSSIGDEIVTTGLQVGSSYHGRRRRRLHPQSYARLEAQRQQPTFATTHAGQTGATSSQEEYDESESEEDRVLTSSAENIASPQPSRSTPLRQVVPVQPTEPDSSDDDEDDRATALGRRPPEPFQPQPNAFSHPPSHLTHRHSTSSTIPEHPHHRPSFGQRSQTRVDRHAPNFMSPHYQADNDAALRASLTTLLSCAAAAGKRSKDGEKETGERPRAPAASNQPVELRFVPESELMAPSPPAQAAQAASQSPRTNPPPSGPRESAGEKVKRAATPTPTSGTKPSRATKKKRTNAASGEEALISPTLLTWVVSAGVVVLVSVVGFGAGYVIGREVGRQEALGSLGAGNASAVADGSNCGREVIRSGTGTLRRFRWGTAVGRSIAA